MKNRKLLCIIQTMVLIVSLLLPIISVSAAAPTFSFTIKDSEGRTLKDGDNLNYLKSPVVISVTVNNNSDGASIRDFTVKAQGESKTFSPENGTSYALVELNDPKANTSITVTVSGQSSSKTINFYKDIMATNKALTYRSGKIKAMYGRSHTYNKHRQKGRRNRSSTR